MKKIIEDFLSLFNGITPILVILFLILTHGNYVTHYEYETSKKQIFERLDNVETLIYKILNNTIYEKDKQKPDAQKKENLAN